MTAANVELLYDRLLGRAPTADDIAIQLRGNPTFEALLDVILASDEYAQRIGGGRTPASRGRRFVNIHHPGLERWTHPAGTWSDDGVAVVGHEGWVFIGGGTNANLEQFTGRAQLPDSWLESWREIVDVRAADARELGVELAYLVVPDKLALQEEHFPEPLERGGPRPIERLLEEAQLPLVYPLEPLRAGRAAGDVCLRTDSHLTIGGNDIVHRELLSAIAAPHSVAPPTVGLEQLRSGDVGSRFDPAIVEVFRVAHSLGAAELVEDNYAQVAGAGGHVGIRRVFRNDEAPDPRTVVVFGDSYAFADSGYQGVAWYLAQGFRSVHFVWVPCGWDAAYVRSVGAELVVCQTAERFVARVPSVRVDSAELVARSVSEPKPISPDAIFDDAPADAG